jgi:hypothetical protein
MSVAGRVTKRPKKSNTPARGRSSKRRWLFIALALPLFVALTVLAHSHFSPKSLLSATSSTSAKTNQLPTVEQLLSMSPAELEKCDIALIDLVCAQGFRGSE